MLHGSWSTEEAREQILDQTLRLESPSVETELRIVGRSPAPWSDLSGSSGLRPQYSVLGPRCSDLWLQTGCMGGGVVGGNAIGLRRFKLSRRLEVDYPFLFRSRRRALHTPAASILPRWDKIPIKTHNTRRNAIQRKKGFLGRMSRSSQRELTKVCGEVVQNSNVIPKVNALREEVRQALDNRSR